MRLVGIRRSKYKIFKCCNNCIKTIVWVLENNSGDWLKVNMIIFSHPIWSINRKAACAVLMRNVNQQAFISKITLLS